MRELSSLNEPYEEHSVEKVGYYTNLLYFIFLLVSADQIFSFIYYSRDVYVKTLTTPNKRRIIMNEFTSRIQNAIAATKELGKAGVIPENYYENTVAQRSPKTGCGSIVTSFRGKEVFDGIGHLCFFDAWEGWKPYDNCPNLIPGCVAFRNDDLGGELGIVKLSGLDPKSEVTLDDRKHTGNVSATVSGIRGKYANFVVAILGVENGKEILFTFHPGDPCMPSKVKTEPGFHGRKVTVAEAMAMGLETAKIV